MKVQNRLTGVSGYFNMQLDNGLQKAATETFARMPLMLDAIQLMNKIEQKIHGKSDLTSLGIKTSLMNGTPMLTIIRNLAEQAYHCTDPLVEILGDSLVIQIYKLNEKAKKQL